MERLLTTSVERDGAEPVLLCSNTYDDLGRLATQSLGGNEEGLKLDKRTAPVIYKNTNKSILVVQWHNCAMYGACLMSDLK